MKGPHGVVRGTCFAAGLDGPIALRDDKMLAFPVIQDEPRGHPLGGDALHPVTVIVARRRGPLRERGIEISQETARYWWNRFGPMFAAEIRGKCLEAMRAHRHCQ